MKITQIVKNQEELYMRQYDQPMNHEEKKDDLIDIDMDELLEQIQAKQL